MSNAKILFLRTIHEVTLGAGIGVIFFFILLLTSRAFGV